MCTKDSGASTANPVPMLLRSGVLIGLLLATSCSPGGPEIAAPMAEQELEGPEGPSLALGTVAGLGAGDAVQDVRVNDATRLGELVACTQQNEVAIAARGAEVYVGFNDSQNCAQSYLGQISRTTGGTQHMYSTTGFARSGDGGGTFQDVGPVAPNGPIAQLYGDPAIAVDDRGESAGMVYLASNATAASGSDAIGVARSSDGGRTFSWADGSGGIGGDKPWLAVDNTGGEHDGRVYLTWSGNSQEIYLAFSDDEGRTWKQTQVGTGFSGSRPAIGPNGDVHVAWMDHLAEVDIEDPPVDWALCQTAGDACFVAREWYAVSHDGGSTFSPQKLVATMPAMGALDHCGGLPQQAVNGGIRHYEHPSLAIDTLGSDDPNADDYNPHRGTAYIVFPAGGMGADEADIYLTRLAPGASSWTTPRRMNDDATTADQLFPEAVVPGPGKLAVAWTDRREDAAGPSGNLKMRQYSALSVDGGATFGPNQQASEVLFPPIVSNPNYSQSAPCYAGDYNGMWSDGDGTVLAAWGDNRDTVYSAIAGVGAVPDANVYFRRLLG